MPDADLFGHPLSPDQVSALAAASGQAAENFDPGLASGPDLVLASLMNLAPTPGHPLSPYVAFRAGESETLDLVFSFAYTAKGDFSFRELYANSPNSALFLNTQDADFFQNGIPGVTTSIAETVSWLAAIRDHIGFRRLRAIGMSMGGYAALLFGDLLDADDIYAFSPAIDGRFVFVGQRRDFADATDRLRRVADRAFISFGAHELSDFVGFHHCLKAGLPIAAIHLVGNGHGGVPAFRFDRLVTAPGRVAADHLIATPHTAVLTPADVALLAEAMLAVNAGEAERVVALVGDVLRRDPHNPGLYYRLGVHLALAGLPAAARAAFAGSARLYADLASLLGREALANDANARRRLIRDYAHLLDYERLRAVAALLDAGPPAAIGDPAPPSSAEPADPWSAAAAAIARRAPLSWLAVSHDDAVLLAWSSPTTAALVRGCDIARAVRRAFGAVAARDADIARLGVLLASAVTQADGISVPRANPGADHPFHALAASIEAAEKRSPVWRGDGAADADADAAALASLLAPRLAEEVFLGVVAPEDGDLWPARWCPRAEILRVAMPAPDTPSTWAWSLAQRIDATLALAESLPVPFAGAVFVLAAGVAGKLIAPSLARRGAIVIDIGEPPPAPGIATGPALGSSDRAGLVAWAIAAARRRAEEHAGDRDAALRLLDDAGRLAPGHGAVALERVALLIAGGRAGAAAAEARAATAAAADPAWTAWQCADLFAARGHNDAARDLLETALRAQPMHPRLLAAHARVLAGAGMPAADGPGRRIATDFVLNRIEHAPGAADDPALARAAGLLRAARGDIAGARLALERAAGMATFDPAVAVDLARARRAAGDLTGARAAAIRAAVLEPSVPEALEFMEAAQ